MTSEPTNSGRLPDGTFAPGNPFGGKPKGARHRVTRAIEALLEGQHAELTAKAVQMALAGDTVALRLCLDRLAPPRKDTPISIELPPVRTAKDAEASAAVLETVAAGEITPDEAARVLALLTAHKSLIETCELETRLADS